MTVLRRPVSRAIGPSPRSGVRRAVPVPFLLVATLAATLSACGSSAPTAEKVQLPNVVGKTYSEADKVLTAKGVKVRNVAVVSPKPTGIVVSTSPAARSSVPKTTTVVVRYSSPATSPTVNTVPGY
jgi:beta-lactam-binding protein with PASTA domain